MAHDKKKSKHTSCSYNWHPGGEMIGNSENWVFAQPVEDWCLVSYNSIYDNLGILVEMGMVNANWNGLSMLWGTVYLWYCMGLGMSDAKRLEIPSFPE